MIIFTIQTNKSHYEKEVFNYLNYLIDSGVTNMFGAGSYIEKEFELSRLESRKLLTLWMENFDEIKI